MLALFDSELRMNLPCSMLRRILTCFCSYFSMLLSFFLRFLNFLSSMTRIYCFGTLYVVFGSFLVDFLILVWILK